MYNQYYFIVILVLVGLMMIGDLPRYPFKTFSESSFKIIYIYLFIYSIYALVSFCYWCIKIEYFPERFIH